MDCISDLVESQSRLLEALQLSHPNELEIKKTPAGRTQTKLSLNPIYRQVPRVMERCSQHIHTYGEHCRFWTGFWLLRLNLHPHIMLKSMLHSTLINRLLLPWCKSKYFRKPFLTADIRLCSSATILSTWHSSLHSLLHFIQFLAIQ